MFLFKELISAERKDICILKLVYGVSLLFIIDTNMAVSYTHLDVYKRQVFISISAYLNHFSILFINQRS